MTPRPRQPFEHESSTTTASTVGGDPAAPWISSREAEAEVEKKLRLRENWKAMLRQDRPMLGLEQLTISRIFVGANHLFSVYGLYLVLTGHFSWSCLLFQFFYSYLGALGTTIGAHRLWTHKSFKAKLPLQILLMLMQTITAQWSIYKWCLDHRIHHKFTDTNKDPHNSKRGFWFSHLWWYVTPKHPELKEELRSFDMPDLENNPVILFQLKWYPWLVLVLHGLLPNFIVQYFWGYERLHVEALNCLRWVYNTHISSAVNSLAHMIGDRPYDKYISSSDNRFVALIAVGEGWHNYHHTFPWDYKTSEYPWKINVSTMVIDFFAWIGWAYDLKTVSHKMLREKMAKSGDGSREVVEGEGRECKKLKTGNEVIAVRRLFLSGSHHKDEHEDSSCTWGWDDELVTEQHRKMTKILKPEGGLVTEVELHSRKLKLN